MNSILKNKNVFKDKIVLDVGCGTGILSLFAAQAGAKQVIAVDMSDIIDKAIQIANENDVKNIVFLKGKIEEVKLPVEQVDIIISEWMGYFLLFESMLDSVLYARDRYLVKTNGLVLPNLFEMHLFGVNDPDTHAKTISYWSNVYGFKMNAMKRVVVQDAQIRVIEPSCVVTDLVQFKEIDVLQCRSSDIAKFESEFELKISADTQLTGIGASFHTYFNHPLLEEKV
jgi:predicted RNA methylase